MQAGFAEAVMSAPHSLLGLRLRPFCAAHVVFLESVKSPLVSQAKGASANIGDFLLAAKVCAAKPELYHGTWQINPDKIRFTFFDNFRASSLISRRKLDRAIEAWTAYRNDYLTAPERMDAVGHSPAPLSAPGVIATVSASLDYLPEERAWSMPLGLLTTYAECRAEIKGAKIKFKPGEEELEDIQMRFKMAEEKGKQLLEERKKCQS
jgi:hypothetical protein